MINWIIGTLIIGLTVFIVARSVVRMKKGQSSCCSGCTEDKCECGK